MPSTSVADSLGRMLHAFSRKVTLVDKIEGATLHMLPDFAAEMRDCLVAVHALLKEYEERERQQELSPIKFHARGLVAALLRRR